ncbi:MAG TPA: hypothetical protein ENG83_07790 [Nitrospirae bacterium]|nr:hypothetical protein BMS3Abin06_02214 [bacterium BMS3Abin06]HDH12082.1 hypothetical protein [Nitrospirota bacterium]HDZ02231.1 hypothetical protein [Nitrospirota bacterium]
MSVSLKLASLFKETEEDHMTSFLKRNGFYVSAAILIASLIYYLSYASYGFIQGDWGLIVYSVEKFLQGKVFYRDFGVIYTPGIYIYTALFFKLLGVSLHSATFAWSIIRAFNSLLIYLLGARFVSRKAALLLPLLLWLAPGDLHKSFFVFFELLNLLVLVKLLSSNTRRAYFFSGIMASITFLFRIDLFGSFVAAVLLTELLKAAGSLKSGSIISQITRSLKNLSFFSGGAVIVLSFFGLYLYSNGALNDFLDQLLLAVNTAELTWFIKRAPISQIFSWSPWDFAHYALLFIPAVIYSLLLAVLASDMVAGKFTEKDKRLSVLLLYGGMLLSQIMNVPGLGRFFLISPPILVSSMYLVSRHYINDESRYCTSKYCKTLRLIYAGSLSIVNFVFLALIIASCFTWSMFTNGSIFTRLRNTAYLSAPRLKVFTTPEMAEEVNGIIDAIETMTDKDDYIFAYPHLNMYYFVTGRKNPIRYTLIEQYANSDEKQSEVIRELEDKNIKLIVFRTDSRLHAPKIFKYINEHYETKEKIGTKLILMKKDQA